VQSLKTQRDLGFWQLQCNATQTWYIGVCGSTFANRRETMQQQYLRKRPVQAEATQLARILCLALMHLA
jgi:hypothetical protein